MSRPVLAALALAASLALALPAPAAASTEDRNFAFLLDALGFSRAPAGVATVFDHEGVRSLAIDAALREAAARAGSVDLGAIAASAVEPAEGPFCAADCWIVDFGTGPCASPAPALPGVLPWNPPLHPQYWGYAGAIGTMTFDGGAGLVLDWTTKLSTGGAYAGGVVRFGGQSDFFCVEFFGVRIWFPFIDGFVVQGES